MSPFEIITSPLTAYIAPIGEAFPKLHEAPSGNWEKIGTNGARSYDEGGLTVAHSKSYSKIKTAGGTGPVKAVLESEDVMFRLNLLDMTAEAYSLALNGNLVSTVAAGAGTFGYKKVGLSQSVGRTREFALLCRGLSPYNEAYPLQYCIPRCFDSGNAQPIFRKGGSGAALALELTALEDLSAADETERLGYYMAAHQEALP